MNKAVQAVMTLLLALCFSDAKAQKVSITSPATLETYAGDTEYISITNEGVSNATGALTLILDDGKTPIHLNNMKIDQNSSIRHPLKLSNTDALRANLNSPQTPSWAAINVFRGQVMLQASGTKEDASGKPTKLNFVNSFPVVIYGYGYFIPFSNFYALFWAPFLLMLLTLLLGWLGSSRPDHKTKIRVTQLLPDTTWITNFSFFGALVTSVTSVLALDLPNKIAAGLTGAIAVALLALAPLIFNFNLSEIEVDGPAEVDGMTGSVDLTQGSVTLDYRSVTRKIKKKEAPIRWYFLVMGVTSYGASLALVLAFLVIPRTVDVYRGYSIPGANTVEFWLRALLLLFGLVSLLFTRKVIIDSVGQKHARLV